MKDAKYKSERELAQNEEINYNENTTINRNNCKFFILNETVNYISRTKQFISCFVYLAITEKIQLNK